MELSNFQEIRQSLRQLYLDDPRPWLVGFSGGKDSTMVGSLIFETVASIPREQRTKPIAFLPRTKFSQRNPPLRHYLDKTWLYCRLATCEA